MFPSLPAHKPLLRKALETHLCATPRLYLVLVSRDQLEDGRAQVLWAGEGIRDLVRSPHFFLTEFTYEMYGKGMQVGVTNIPGMLRTSSVPRMHKCHC